MIFTGGWHRIRWVLIDRILLEEWETPEGPLVLVDGREVTESYPEAFKILKGGTK